MFILVTSLFSVVLTVRAFPNDGTLVHTERGIIRGHILKSEKGNDYYAFQEIPYAAPPIGENRFQLPKPPKAWCGILNTTRNTKVCYQTYVRYTNLKISEDCLYVNVYTPQKPGSAHLLPVLLWIHGGAFRDESSTYEYFGPQYIMDHGVVVVTFTYRLGAFGWVGTEDGVIPLNLGLKDQRFAIEWVHRNIHLFGGNPKHVVLDGESAGSIAIGYHLMGPWEGGKQLFHGAIMQSGTPIAGLLLQDLDITTATALQLGRRVDPSFTSNDTKELLELLQNADAHDIFSTGISGGVTIEECGPFSYQAFQAFLDENYKKVPVLIGINSEEWGSIALGTSEQYLEELDNNPSELVLPRLNVSPENRPIAGELLKELYTHNTTFAGNLGYFIRFQSDQLFTTATCKQVELASRVVPYYLYQFSFKGYLGENMDILPKLPPGCEKVVHAEEFHYMWDDGNNTDLSKFAEPERLMLHQFVVMWTNFVKYFNPTPVQDPLLYNFTWLPSEPETLRYMNINTTFEMREQPRQYPQVKEILEKYMEPPYNVFS
ncbi:juvenile hormone esterase-like [Diabrotica undecimpunctata]|uniref:juvenile hormone esterase-like n=1 Tax=Diabrotica undecimpunctata TaxID=50387 RepID=UPI003B631FD0